MLTCATVLHAQPPRSQSALSALVQTERAFAARATVVGWKQAFLEYFADNAVGFDGDKTESAKAQLKPVPDPPKICSCSGSRASVTSPRAESSGG